MEPDGAPPSWPSPGSVWLRLNSDGLPESVWLTEDAARSDPLTLDGPYRVERWAVHGADGKPIR